MMMNKSESLACCYSRTWFESIGVLIDVSASFESAVCLPFN